MERDVARIEAPARPQADGDRRIEMAPRDMADRIDHGHDGQTERQSDAEEADPAVGKARRDHRAAAAADNQPEGADELGQTLLHIAPMTLPSRRRSWAPPAQHDVTRTSGRTSGV